VISDQRSETETQLSGLGWAQDQLYELKADVAQLDQQFVQLQAALTQALERMREMEASLREATLNASQAPRLQEELNQAVALIVHLQDQQADVDERLGAVTRVREAADNRDQQEWIEVAKRTEQLERQVASWQDRQSGVEEVGRRFQEGASLLRQQIQQIEQRLEGAEGKSARGLEGANRAEHTLSQIEASVTALQREDETLTERLRVTSEVAHRVETTMGGHLQDLQRIELLAERIELHRAERQRLEDRALRLEEELAELRERNDKADHQRGQLDAHQQGLASRIDGLQERVDELRTLFIDQMRKLTGTQERTKRNQIQELEREIREMKRYVADLKEQ